MGPLVVSAAAFEVPDSRRDASLWEVLSGAVGKDWREDERICVVDSKKLPGGERKLAHLEAAVLSFLAATGQPAAASLEALLEAVDCTGDTEFLNYPWYRDPTLALPAASEATRVAALSSRLSATLEREGMRVAALQSTLLPAGDLNVQFASTRNKSVVLFTESLALLERALSLPFGSQGRRPKAVIALLDKQGGRKFYAPLLQQVFPFRPIRIETETPKLSSYEVRLPDFELAVSFIEKGEDQHLPIALASNVSKYLRELCMILFNRFWLQHKPDLRPTAGYAVDAERFLREVEDLRARLHISPDLFVRHL